MAIPDHPMKRLKGTPEAKQMMDTVRAHRTTKTKPKRRQGYGSIVDATLKGT